VTVELDSLRDQLVRSVGKNVALLAGWVGESRRSNYYRLYLTPRLEDYFEVPASAIVHQEFPSRSQSEYLPLLHLLWIDATATLDYVAAPAPRAFKADEVAQQSMLLQRFAEHEHVSFSVDMPQEPAQFVAGGPNTPADASKLPLPPLPQPPTEEKIWCWIFPC
jgi:hypothetical protein